MTGLFLQKNINVQGFDAASRMFRELPQRQQNRVLQKATRAAVVVGARSVRRAAPRNKGRRSPASQKYGQLYKNIKVEVLRKYRKSRFRKGARISTGDAFWSRFYQYGTKGFVYVTGKRGKKRTQSTGKVRQPARPWFDRAVNPTVPQMEARMIAVIQTETVKQIEILKRKK